jgi:FHA domain
MKDLRAMATSLSADAFRRQLGPMALVEQRAALAAGTDLRVSSGEVGPTSLTQPELIMARMLLLAIETEDLHVMTLPPMRSRDELTVGRQPDCDLVIDDESVSKRHAVLRWDDRMDQTTLQDVGSTNGTFINTAQRITREVVLEDGDIVSFGDVAFWFLHTGTLYARLLNPRLSVRPPAK